MASRRDDERPVFLPQLDYNGSLWLAYQQCIQAPLFGRHIDTFDSCVRILCSILAASRKYLDDDYTNAVKGDKVPAISFFAAAVDAMWRHGFFESRDKVDLVG